MHPFLFLFLLCLLNGAFGYSLEVQGTAVAGGSVRVEWTRSLGGLFGIGAEDDKFEVRLKQGNSNGPSASVDARFGQGRGTVSLSVAEPGNHVVELVTSDRGRTRVRATSRTFQVQAPPNQPQTPPPPPPPSQPSPPQPPANPPASTPTPPAGPPSPPADPPSSPPTNTAPNAPPAESSSQNGGASTTTSSNVQVGGAGTDPSGATGTPDEGRSTNPVVIGGSTFTPETTEQVITLTSNDQTLVTTISPISFPTDSTSGTVAPSSAAKKASGTLAIIGGILGSVFFLLLLFLLLIFYRRRQRRRATNIFFRDKMVRNTTTDGLPTPRSATSDAPLANPSGIPYADLNEKIRDYDQSQVGTPLDAQRGFDPYAGMYESTYGAQAYTPTPHTIYETGPSASHHGLFTLPTGAVPPTNAPEMSPLGLPSPRTDRQMELHERIIDLQAQMISFHKWGNRYSASSMGSLESAEYSALKRKKETLESLMQSPWALGHTDIVPPEYRSDSVSPLEL